MARRVATGAWYGNDRGVGSQRSRLRRGRSVDFDEPLDDEREVERVVVLGRDVGRGVEETLLRLGAARGVDTAGRLGAGRGLHIAGGRGGPGDPLGGRSGRCLSE